MLHHSPQKVKFGRLEVRARLDAMSATEKTIENAKNADRQAVRRAIIQLRETAEYQSASKAEQDTLVERAKKRVMDGR
jgi:hypothetical protein